MKYFNLLSFLFFIWFKIKKVNLKEENLILKNNILQSSNEDDDSIKLEPYKIEKLLFDIDIKLVYNCNGICNKIYFSIDKANIYGLSIKIYESSSNKEYIFYSAVNITKNQIVNLDFENSTKVYFVIKSLYKKRKENNIYVFHEGVTVVNVFSYLDKNFCYKIPKLNNLSFNFGTLYDGYTFLHLQSINSKRNIKYTLKSGNETKNYNEKSLNKYFNLTNNSILSLSLENENENEFIDLDICLDLFESYYINITKESSEYSRILVSPGGFLFYSGIDNIKNIGYFLLTLNYNKEPFNISVECKISDDENDVNSDFNDFNLDKDKCEIIKDKFNYENYHIYFKVNENKEKKHRIILMKVNINKTTNFAKQYFSIYKNYPTFELNMESKERNISLSKNPYFFQINLSNKIYDHYSQILLLTNEDNTMNIIKGEFTKENYDKIDENKIQYIQILNIQELKNSNINILTIMFHTAVSHQKVFFYYKCYTDNVHFIINKEGIVKDIDYKIELNDCVNGKYYYFGIYKKRNENIAFIDYLYGIGETYHSSHMDPLSLEQKFKYKKFNDSISPLTNFSYNFRRIEIYSIQCYSPILAYLSINPYLLEKKDGLKEGEKLTFYLTKGKNIDFNIINNLNNNNMFYYEIILNGDEVNLTLSTDNNEKITYNKSGVYRKELNQISKLSFINNGNDTYIKLKIGKQTDFYILNLNEDSQKDINEEKNLIINVTREEKSKFKELKVSFNNDGNNEKNVCLYFGYGKFPYVNIPTDNCVKFEKDKIKEFVISYPFEKIYDNNSKSYFMDDDFYLIFAFPDKIIKPNIEIIKKEKSIEITNYQKKINNNKQFLTDYYTIKSSEYNKTIKNMGIFLYISIINLDDIYKKINYTLSYSNKIIHQNETYSNSKSIRMYYNFQDNFINYDLKVTSNVSYNIYLTYFEINYDYQINFITNDFSITKNDDKFTFYKLFKEEEETTYYYITGNSLESVNDYSNLSFNNKIEYNQSENEISLTKAIKDKEYYFNIFARQEKNYKLILFYEPFYFKSQAQYGKLIFIFVLIFFMIVLIIIVIFKKEKIDQSVIEEQIESDLPLVQT